MLAAATAAATTTRTWVVDSAADFLKGKGEGVAVTDDGRLVPVLPWGQPVPVEEPVLMAGAVDSGGRVFVATGNPARLYELTDHGLNLLAEVPAEQVTALLASPSGTLYVGTAAPAAVFRWAAGRLEEAGRLEAGGVWDLAWYRGEAVAATGPPGALYRVKERGFERWLELPDAHARCLAVTGDSLLAGTSGKGLIVRIDPHGGMSIIADSSFTEIADLLAAPDGAVWAAAVVGEPAAEPAKSKKGKEGATTGVVNLKLPKVNGATATSEILRLTPEGALLRVHRFDKQVASALAWDGAGVLVGTGFEGEIWRFGNHGGARLAVVDAVQVTGFLGGGAEVLTQGPARVLRRATAGHGGGTFRGQARSFPQPVRLGRYQISPPDPAVRIRFRSGVTADPSPTWLPWSDWLPAEGSRVPLPPVKALQWEVEVPRRDGDLRVERVEVAYREVNLAPRIAALEVAEPGEVFLAAPPPSGQIVDVSHPDVNGVFTVLRGRPDRHAKSIKRGKRYWRVGYRTASWKAVDPNKDPLRFSVFLEGRNGFELPVRKELTRTQLALDTTAVPDGWYRFRLVATDEPGNSTGALTAEERSRWFVVDNTPPRVVLRRDGGRWTVEVKDGLSPLARVEWARDGERWHALSPDDGILDEPTELFHLPAEGGRHLLVVRAIDRHHNRATAGAVEESP